MTPSKNLYRVTLANEHSFTVVALTFEEALKKAQNHTKDVPVNDKGITHVGLLASIDVE